MRINKCKNIQRKDTRDEGKEKEFTNSVLQKSLKP